MPGAELISARFDASAKFKLRHYLIARLIDPAARGVLTSQNQQLGGCDGRQ